MEKSKELKMKERLDLINKIQTYLKENDKDGLLIFEEDHLEPYFDKLTGVPCSIPALLYISKEEKPRCLVSNLEINAIKATGLFEEKDVTEHGHGKAFKTAAKEFIGYLKGKKILANFAEKNPAVDQLSHDNFQEYLQEQSVESSEYLWKSIDLKLEGKEYNFTPSLKIRKERVKELKSKILKGQGFLLINGTGKKDSQTYACYLMGFLKKQKYAIAVKNGKAVAIVHKDESLKEHPFDKVLTYQNMEEFQNIISDYYKDINDVYFDKGLSEGNYRLIKNTLSDKLKFTLKDLVQELLSVKIPGEVKEIEKACKINDAIFDYLEKELKAGMSEEEVSELIKKKALSYSETMELSFPSLVAAGESGANIHHYTSDYKIQKGDLLLIDIGVRLKTGMGSDTTCMFYFGESPPARIKKYDKVVDKAINAVVKKIKPGKFKLDADIAARKEITKHHPNFLHGTGHSLDLKCHGSGEGMRAQPTGTFEEGGVFSVEPGIYITKENVSEKYPKVEGFRKEILIWVTKNGVKRLSKIPKLRLIES